MVRAPEPRDRRAIEAGTVAGMVAHACRQCDCEVGELLDYAIKPGEVILILPTGQKVRFEVVPAAGQPAGETSPPAPLRDAEMDEIAIDDDGSTRSQRRVELGGDGSLIRCPGEGQEWAGADTMVSAGAPGPDATDTNEIPLRDAVVPESAIEGHASDTMVSESAPGGAAADTNEIPLAEAVAMMHKITPLSTAGRRKR